jgi:hypothetical protein
MNVGPQKSLIAQLVDAACCVVGADTGVTRIIVVANQRLPYDELVALRGHAQACDADFVMSGNGTVVVRRAEPPAVPEAIATPPTRRRAWRLLGGAS